MKKFLQLQQWNIRWLKHNNGYLLIEFAVVLALIACLAALVSSSGNFLDRMAVRAELSKIYATCSYLQQYALASNQPQTLTFDIACNLYRYHGQIHSFAPCVRFGVRAGIHGPPSAPTHVIARASTFVNDTITFYPDGIIQPGTVYLTDRAGCVTYALSSGIAQVSHLRCYAYTGSWQPWYT